MRDRQLQHAAHFLIQCAAPMRLEQDIDSTPKHRLARARARSSRRAARCSSTAASAPALSGATFDCISPDRWPRASRRWLPAMRRTSMPRWPAAAPRFERGDWSRRCTARSASRCCCASPTCCARTARSWRSPRRSTWASPSATAWRWMCRRAANCIQWYAEAVDKIYDEVAPTGPNALALVTREPLGVVGADRAVEFPADHGGVEDRARSWRPATRWC